ncbi:hypothetical protein HZA57_08440, partial [Candidatus Poribacteria bacterium]|nr:hypothetical protein [Candidatus Poribacteria bacterium]
MNHEVAGADSAFEKDMLALLERVACGAVSPAEAARAARGFAITDLGFA